jgi:hypothetical protein
MRNFRLAGEIEMVEPKRGTKLHSLRTTHRPERRQGKQTGTKELVLTLSVPDGEVVKVEMLDKSGQRQELSEEEFAELVGEDEEEISPEEAYAAGIADASEEEEFQLDEEGGRDEEAFERFILREMIARQILRRGVRRFILRRLRKRETIRSKAHRGGKAAHQAGRNNGQEGTREGG